MNLFDMLNQAQGGAGGQGMEALARQFGLSQQQTQSAVEALLPAFSKGFQQTTADPYGLGSLLTMLGAGGQSNAFQDISKAFTPQGADIGNNILGQLFGSKDLSRAVAAQASQATGIGQDILQKMLPVLATMLMGGMFNQTNQQLKAGTFGASNPLGEIIEQMMRQGGQGGGQGGAQRAPQPAPQSDNPLGDILGQILRGGAPQDAPQPRQQPRSGGSGNPLEDILGQILGGGQQRGGDAPTPRGGQGNNPLGDILNQILKGGGQTGSAQQPEEEPEAPAPQRRQPRQQQQPANPLEDILGKMFRPGGSDSGQQSDQYQQGIDNIFEQFRRGMDRRR